MVKHSRVKFQKRFNFALTEAMYNDIHTIAEQANDDVAEVVRRMIARQTPFFMTYTSRHRRLPNGEARGKAQG